MTALRHGTVAALAGLLLSAAPAQAGPQVKLSSELGQAVMIAGEKGKAYLRVNLEGIPLPEEGAYAPVNVVLVIDRSGSMEGARIEQAKEAALMAVDRLGEGDVLGVVAYNHLVDVLVPGGPLRDTEAVRHGIRLLRADGRTALYAGVSQGIRELREFVDPYRVNRIILLSDGLANVGPSQPHELQTLGREAAGEGISVTTIGLGLGYNEDLMTRLALASDGNHAFVEHADDLVDIFNEEFGDAQSVVAQDVEIIIDCPEGFEPLRALGRTAEIKGRRVRFKLGQLSGKQHKYAVVELAVTGSPAQDRADLAKVQVTYTDMATKTGAALQDQVQVRFSGSKKEAEASINKDVMAAVTTQIATERNEQAVSLRDAGKIEEARKALEDNAAYLREQAERLSAPALRTLSKKNLDDAGALSGSGWDRQRKEMRARQYKDKTQQSY